MRNVLGQFKKARGISRASALVRLDLVVVIAALCGLLLLPAPARSASSGADGRLVFSSGRFGVLELFTMRADGSGVVRVADSQGNTVSAIRPAWSPDGRRIAYERIDPLAPQTPTEIHVVNPDGSGDTRLSPPGAASETLPAWSPDGSKLAFSRSGQIFVRGLDGTGEVQLTNSMPFNLDPAWSPDGEHIAFASDRDGRDLLREIYVMNADGSDETRLTNNPAQDSQPSWSPDGTKILFTSERDGGGIYLMKPDGSEQTRLVAGGNGDHAVWSPDGTRIAYSSFRDGDSDVYVINADGTHDINLTNDDPRNDMWADWGIATDSSPGSGLPPSAPSSGSGSAGGGVPVDLQIAGLVEPASVGVGATLTWRLQLIVKTNALAMGAYVDVTLPAGVLLVSSTTDRGPGCSVTAPGRLRCSLDFLYGQAPVGNITLVTSVTAPGELVLSATGGYAGTDPTPADNTISIRANTLAAVAPVSAPPVTRTPAAQKGVTRAGTAKANTMVGTALADDLRGLGGNDRIDGRGGNDKLYGGAGNDTLTGGAGVDLLEGGAGNDRLASRDGVNDTIHCGSGTDTVIADKKDTVAHDCESVKRT